MRKTRERMSTLQQDVPWRGETTYILKPFNPPFEHDALERLTPEQKNRFQVKMGILITSFRSQVEHENHIATNSTRALKSLEGHLKAICELVGPSEREFWPVLYYSIGADLECESVEEKIIKEFPESIDIMHRLVKTSRENGKFKLRLTAAKTPTEIACEAARLLNEFEIPARVTVTSKIKESDIWSCLTRFILREVFKTETTDANMKNILFGARKIIQS